MLFEKEGQIGGQVCIRQYAVYKAHQWQFNMAKLIPGKEEFHETLRYYRVMLDKHHVQVGMLASANL